MWYRVDQTTQGPASLARRVQIRSSEISRGKTFLRNFNPVGDRLKDLEALGVSAADIRKLAGPVEKGGASLVDIRNVPPHIKSQIRPGAAFAASEQSRIIIYNAENFWQPDYEHVLGTLLHEFIHLARKNFEDAGLQKKLGLTVNGIDTTDISKKLTQDCFKK